MDGLTARAGAEFSWGGWLEDRAHLWRGSYLPPGGAVHIGIDINAPAGTRVLSPLEGEVVHAVPDSELGGGWGGWLVLRADAYYQSQTENALSVSPKYRDTLDGFAIFNASATWSHGNWDTTLWLKNIANEAGVTGVYKEEYMGTVPAVGYYGNGSKALTALGRTLGLTVSYRF